jgi:hypothetical protein
MASSMRALLVAIISLAVILLVFFSGAAAATVVGDTVGWTYNQGGYSTTESGIFMSMGGFPAILAIQIL